MEDTPRITDLIKHEAWVVLPSPPSINQKFISRTFVLSKKYRDFKNICALKCHKFKMKKFHGDVSIDLKWYRPAKRGDLDGIIKVVLDGLTIGGAWEDDRQVTDLRVSRSDEDPKNSRVVVVIKGYIERRNNGIVRTYESNGKRGQLWDKSSQEKL